MKVLVLSPCPERLKPAIAAAGDRMMASCERVGVATLAERNFEFIVSYGYRHLIGREVIAALGGRIVNLHVSLLPWNRGSDPNFWSFFDATPKGVSIHRVGRGLAAADLLAQERLEFGPNETLSSAYGALCARVEALLVRTWPLLRCGLQPAFAQTGDGSYHRSRDKDPFFARLPAGWESPVRLVEEMGRRHREHVLKKVRR